MYTSVSARAAASYRQTSVTGASPHQIVALLFDALSQALHSALDGIDRNDAEAKGRQIGRAVRLLDEGLKAGLDDARGGDLAANLRTLYEYAIRQLTLANLSNDREILTEVIGLVAPVAQAWRQMDPTAAPEARMPGGAAATPSAMPSSLDVSAIKGRRAMSFYSA